MVESKQHLLLKTTAKDRFINSGYELVSFDQVTVHGYKPDIILENDYEVLFVEVVVTSDHDLSEVPLRYKNKPVRFIKYYSLESWLPYFGKNRKTTIEVSEGVWKKLNVSKNLGETFNDVLMRLLELEEEDD